MATKNFTNFNLSTSPLTGDYIVGYCQDGSTELRTAVSDLGNTLKTLPGFSVYTTGSGCNSIIPAAGNNTISGDYSNISGGINNTVSGYYSTIAGGNGNCASDLSFVGGGLSNCACSNYTFIGGGEGNYVRSVHGVIAGGCQNSASGDYSAIVGGENNCITPFQGDHNFIGGGQSNTISGYHNSIAGGNFNTMSTYVERSTIASGILNSMNAGDSGGCLHIYESTITHGCCNCIYATANDVNEIGSLITRSTMGGNNNTIAAFGYFDSANSVSGCAYICNSSILNGIQNCICGTASSVYSNQQDAQVGVPSCIISSLIVSGSGNKIVNDQTIGSQQPTSFSTILNGSNNCICTDVSYSTVVGGYNNISNSNCSFIAGGCNNQTSFNNSNTFILGSNLKTSRSNFTYVNNLSSQGIISAGSLSAGSPVTTFNNNPLTIVATASGSVYESLQNTVAGVSASTDISIYNDLGTIYLDMGINSSKYNGNIYSPKFNVVGANDSYFYSTSANLAHGTAGSVGDLIFFTGGSLSGTSVNSGNERLRIKNTNASGNGGFVGINTSNPNQQLTVVGNVSSTGIVATSALRVIDGVYPTTLTNTTMGSGTLVTNASATIATTAVTNNSRIFITIQNPVGSVGVPFVASRTATTSFTVSSTNINDRSGFAWLLVEPA